MKQDNLNNDITPQIPNDYDLNLNEIYRKVEVDQDEAKEIFNNMIKDLEVDIDKPEQEEHTEYEFQKPHPKTKYESLDNLAGNIQSELHHDGFAEQDEDKMSDQDAHDDNDNTNSQTNINRSRPASSHIRQGVSRPATGKSVHYGHGGAEGSPNDKMNESEDD